MGSGAVTRLSFSLQTSYTMAVQGLRIRGVVWLSSLPCALSPFSFAVSLLHWLGLYTQFCAVWPMCDLWCYSVRGGMTWGVSWRVVPDVVEYCREFCVVILL